METKAIRYSEAFKRQVVRELAEGKFKSHEQARRAYGLGGGQTIECWVRKYGTEDLQPKLVRIQTMKERDELKEARVRIRELEAALSDAHIDHCLEEAYLRMACDRLGVAPEDFKKKLAMTLSGLRGSRGGAGKFR
jgi:transposase